MVDNLLYLARRKRALRRPQPQVCIITVVIGQNHDTLLDVAALAEKVSADRVLYRAFNDVADPCLSPLVPSSEEDSVARRQARQAARYLEQRGIDHNVRDFLTTCGRQLDTTRLYQAIPCYYGWLALRVDYRGDVYPCCGCYQPLGNLHDRSLLDVWNGPDYREFRRRAVRLNRGGDPPGDCACDMCPHGAANARTYRALHPLRSRTSFFRRLCAASGSDPMDDD
jgi:MoaA/NifB/PqqE/SkfB family radical SAM enzyme